MQDLRVSIGLFFVILGLLLAATPASGAVLTQAPVNLYTGCVSVAFGALMLVLSRRR